MILGGLAFSQEVYLDKMDSMRDRFRVHRDGLIPAAAPRVLRLGGRYATPVGAQATARIRRNYETNPLGLWGGWAKLDAAHPPAAGRRSAGSAANAGIDKSLAQKIIQPAMNRADQVWREGARPGNSKNYGTDPLGTWA